MRRQPIQRYVRTAFVIVTVLSVVAGPAAAQPEPPHKIYGTVTDQDGNTVSGETVTVTYNGSQIASTTTDTDGDYEVQMSDPDSGASGESLTITVKDTTNSTTWESAKSERIDFSVTVNTGSSGGGGGGGGGGVVIGGDDDDGGDPTPTEEPTEGEGSAGGEELTPTEESTEGEESAGDTVGVIETETETETETDDDTNEPTEGSGPGFTAIIALVALVAAALLAVRRDN